MKIKIIAFISLVLLAMLPAQEPDPLWAPSDVITFGDGEVEFEVPNPPE